MISFSRRQFGIAAFVCLLLISNPAPAQLLRQPENVLHYVYPAGGKQGQTVPIELGAFQGLEGAKALLVDGPPGVTVKDVKAISGTRVTATLTIAADALPGLRQIRVLGGSNGITGSRAFHVGTLPEIVEKEPNNDLKSAQHVVIPAVINGRFDPALDVDCFRFDAKRGQRIIAAVYAQGMDSRMRNKGGNGGYVDANLELIDATGKVLASAEDTLGLDPMIEHLIPVDGSYTVRLQVLGFDGSAAAVYRLTLGEVPYPTAIFPAGGSGKVQVEFLGPNLPSKTTRLLTARVIGSPWQTVGFDHALSDGRELPFLRGEGHEIIETEPNNQPDQATPLKLRFPGDEKDIGEGIIVNGRFNQPGDVDCFKITLKKGQSVLLEATAQRHLRSPVDTLIEVLDASGKKIAENDDGDMFSGQCEHDFPSSDSRLEFTAAQDGDFIVRISDQNGTSGPRAIYRLSVQPLVPDFRLNLWPDAVPIWGPGSTASFVIQVQRWGGLTGDIQLRIEDLAPGWKGSAGLLGASGYVAPRHGLNQKALLTITAPADAPVGAYTPFRVVGKTLQKTRTMEREAWPQTLLGSSHTDRMHLRYGSMSYAAVAPAVDCRLETPVTELTATLGQTIQIPVKVIRTAGAKGPIAISIDGETVAVNSGWRVPLALKPDESEILLPLEVKERKPGTYGIVVSRSWAADLRAGRPGPCTPLIMLHLKEAAKKP